MVYLTLEAPSEASLWSLDRASSTFPLSLFVFKPPLPKNNNNNNKIGKPQSSPKTIYSFSFASQTYKFYQLNSKYFLHF
jgi:hypothetical protein